MSEPISTPVGAPISAPISAMNAASFDGLVRVEDSGLQGMITLRGDLSSAAVKKAVKAATGAKLPAPTTMTAGDSGQVLWMSPDELLILCDYDSVEDTLATVQEALGSAHALAVNVSDARAMFRLTGPHVREVLAKLCPVDFAPGSFEPGAIRRTRMAQIAAAVWLEDDTTARVICFRSVGQYAFDLLKTAAAPGSGVGVY